MGAQLHSGRSQHSTSSRRARRKPAAMSEINVTPFVDVMLVLLIIFMVAAPLLTVGVPVELPKTAATPLPSQQEEPLTVTITAEGQLLIQSTPTEPETLVEKLQAIAAERSGDQIYLRADGAVVYEDVMKIMGALNGGGFTSIGLVTEPVSPTLDTDISATADGSEK